MKTTWRILIENRMKSNGETFFDIEHSTITEQELGMEFDSGYGSPEGVPFTIWTKNYVYFPVQYDGSEWCGSVPRNPCEIRTRHIGGG
jgi:hypothetical protein